MKQLDRSALQKHFGVAGTAWGVCLVLALLAFALGFCVTPSSVEAARVSRIEGAGASFPAPVYEKWAGRYYQLKRLRLSYQAIGSGGGQKKIKEKKVDFGASDKPMSMKELEKHGLIQFPMIMGGVVPVVHLPGVRKAQLKLTTDLLADIFLGKITKWDDPRIQAVNPDLKLPAVDVTVVHRKDGSGTTWIFTSYLCKISGEWKAKVGAGKDVKWPVGEGAKGNQGIAALVRNKQGAIGYVAFDYAAANSLPYCRLQNLSGNFVEPTIEAFQAAAENAAWDRSTGFAVDLNDPPGEGTWPINGASYILIYKDQPDKDKAQAMLEFFDWCYQDGPEIAEKLHYVPIPPKVFEMMKQMWATEVTTAGHYVWK